jgi:hypothetical protein
MTRNNARLDVNYYSYALAKYKDYYMNIFQDKELNLPCPFFRSKLVSTPISNKQHNANCAAHNVLDQRVQ